VRLCAAEEEGRALADHRAGQLKESEYVDNVLLQLLVFFIEVAGL
jgi:hypothetical protein